MDVVYVRWHAGEPQEVAEAVPESTATPDITASKRTWKVTIQANSRPAFATTITDPFLEAEYKDVFEDYLRNSDQQHWSLQSLELEDGTDDISRAEDRIQVYGEMLLGQIGFFRPGLLRAGITEVQLVIAEHHAYYEEEVPGGIHCLAWELLESVKYPLRPDLRLKVTRVSDFDFAGQPPSRPPGPPRSLSSVQGSANGVFHVLLVIARDFSRRGAARDPEPDLAQWPLMSVQKKLKSRMLLEVVRPGSIEELDEHLKVRAGHGVLFNLVHFDLHGRITRDEYGNQVPGLLFAKGYEASSSPHRHQVPPTHLARATDVAKVLAEYRVENVVLNACLSAYNRTGPTTNLAHILLQHGILNVSAMWFYVHWKTVTTYLGTFYNELLIKGTDFHLAAQRGRDAIRKNPTCRTGKAYEDSFLCVNYTRSFSRPGAIQREPSPTPSMHSADSSTSTTSMKSFMSGKWRGSSPRLSDSFLVADEPIIRLELHLLELEYKLMTCRVVYASDLRKASDSDLNVTIERMVSMWLNTNLIDEVFYYKAKDFAKPRFRAGTVSHREKRTRASNGRLFAAAFPAAGAGSPANAAHHPGCGPGGGPRHAGRSAGKPAERGTARLGGKGAAAVRGAAA